jgi:hypothetical protein
MTRGGDVPQSFAAVALEMSLYAATTASLLVAENIDARGRRWSAGGALAQFVTVAAAGWLLVPLTGAAGAFGALCAGEVVKAAALHHVARWVDKRGMGEAAAVMQPR